MRGKPPVIGLSGKARSGKDTAAQILVEEFGYTRYAFADAMKVAALALDPIVDAWIDADQASWVKSERLSDAVSDLGWEGAKSIPEVRRTLQRLGTEVGRNLFGANFWVDQTFKAIEAAGVAAVITDVRFPNEARAVEKHGLSYLVRIERPGLDHGAVPDHPSETALDDFDFEEVVVNDGSIEDLHRQIATYGIQLDTLLTQF